MENLNIAVVSPDEAYNRVLCMALLDTCRQISVTEYTTREFVLQWADGADEGAYYDRHDLILWAGSEISDSYGGCVVYLTDRASQVNIDHGNSRYALYKYSRADVIVAAVFDIYAHLTGRQALLVKRNDVRLIAIASYCGGAGCTTISRAVSQELARFRSRRVMYLSLEDVASAADFLPLQGGAAENVRTVGEYLYRLLGKNAAPFLEPYLVRDPFGVCCFAPAAGKNPLRELSGEEMQRLLAALMDSGAFDVIAVDASTALGESAMAVCRAADRICLISGEMSPGMRERHYLRQLESSCGEDIKGRIVRTERLAEPPPSPAAPLEGKFGQEISKLTEQLFDMIE